MTKRDNISGMKPTPTEQEALAHVQDELEARHWSARDASRLSGLSNETWSRAFRSGRLTDKLKGAVSVTFGWPPDWYRELPQLTTDATASLQPARTAEMGEIRQRLDAVLALLESLAQGQLAGKESLAALERKLDAALPAAPPAAGAHRASAR